MVQRGRYLALVSFVFVVGLLKGDLSCPRVLMSNAACGLLPD
jgi:hypothetical protein